MKVRNNLKSMVRVIKNELDLTRNCLEKQGDFKSCRLFPLRKPKIKNLLQDQHFAMRSLKLACFLFIAVSMSSCAIHMAYEYDYGKKAGEFRYMGLRVKQFWVIVNVSSDRKEIRIGGGLSKYNAPAKAIKDTILTVHFIEEKLSFPDGTVLEKKYRIRSPGRCLDREGKEIPCLEEFYTCDNFKKKLRKNKYINLKIVYDLDSLGVVTRKEKECVLVKKRYYRIALDHL